MSISENHASGYKSGQKRVTQSAVMSQPELQQEITIQCPACDWSADLGDFDHVRLGGKVQIHCPSCDANLGSLDLVLKRAA